MECLHQTATDFIHFNAFGFSQSSLDSVFVVFGLRTPFKIRDGIVQLVSVNVVDLRIPIWVRQKFIRHKPMNKVIFYVTIVAERHLTISVCIKTLVNEFAVSLDSSVVADLI
jgi:hypothetical protein